MIPGARKMQLSSKLVYIISRDSSIIPTKIINIQPFSITILTFESVTKGFGHKISPKYPSYGFKMQYRERKWQCINSFSRDNRTIP